MYKALLIILLTEIKYIYINALTSNILRLLKLFRTAI